MSTDTNEFFSDKNVEKAADDLYSLVEFVLNYGGPFEDFLSLARSRYEANADAYDGTDESWDGWDVKRFDYEVYEELADAFNYLLERNRRLRKSR